ncbi:hypothetical protein BM525_20995 (plasmid) [Alteromonas mediterranea]|uniref:Uncharacterized protein n=1 Tax=Alteromonas mediterranea TaxID=314275 RepID=A0AAC9JE20_9ALTE|nr:hypothetical protein [Alteromonas mediterranea]APD92339.1 hypothetical protein BM524_20770 [Alteromonas mediterranea]APE00200.1 hypothetical protein BM525_20995 [Alteromonas mediterranea]
MSETQTVQEYIRDQYESNKALRLRYPSFNEFKKAYLGSQGLTNYLPTLRGKQVPTHIGLEVGLFLLTVNKELPAHISTYLLRIEQKYNCTFLNTREWTGLMWESILQGYQTYAALNA